MSVTDEYLRNNAAHAGQFSGPLPLPPSKGTAVVACMDARLNVYGILGLNEGESHVIRNAGGVVTDDEIRSLAPRGQRSPSRTWTKTSGSRSRASRRARSSRTGIPSAASSSTSRPAS
jgi:hypothetical protein